MTVKHKFSQWQYNIDIMWGLGYNIIHHGIGVRVYDTGVVGLPSGWLCLLRSF